MKNSNSIIALTVGILCGILAFFLLYQKASDIEKKSTPVEILFATRFIPAGNWLKPEMVERRSIPGAFVVPSAIHDVRDVQDMVNLVPISAGEQIMANKFGSGDDSLALALNNGYRAFTLEVNETSGVGDLLHPGNRVDLLTKVTTGKREITAFALQDIQVIAVGQKLNGPSNSAKTSNNNSGSGSSSTYSTVTLAVTPEQAETLMYLEGHPLRLVLRAPSDDEIVSLSPQSESEVLSKLGHFSPRTNHKIEIIHGE